MYICPDLKRSTLNLLLFFGITLAILDQNIHELCQDLHKVVDVMESNWWVWYLTKFLFIILVPKIHFKTYDFGPICPYVQYLFSLGFYMISSCNYTKSYNAMNFSSYKKMDLCAFCKYCDICDNSGGWDYKFNGWFGL